MMQACNQTTHLIELMSALLLLPPPPPVDEAFPEFTAPLKVVVVFSDPILARKSAHIYNHMIEQFAPDGVFTAAWWNFDRLHEPESFSAATRAAKIADIIMVAAYADSDLPDAVKTWIDIAFWKQAGRERLLIGLLGLATALPPGDSPPNRYLQAVAREAGMEYLLHWSTLPAPTSGVSLENLEIRANVVTPLLAEILSHATAVPHGGIND